MIAFIVVTGLLLVYMLYLVVEARFFKGTKTLAEDTNISYEQHLDEEVKHLLNNFEVLLRSIAVPQGHKYLQVQYWERNCHTVLQSPRSQPVTYFTLHRKSVPLVLFPTEPLQ